MSLQRASERALCNFVVRATADPALDSRPFFPSSVSLCFFFPELTFFEGAAATKKRKSRKPKEKKVGGFTERLFLPLSAPLFSMLSLFALAAAYAKQFRLSERDKARTGGGHGD